MISVTRVLGVVLVLSWAAFGELPVACGDAALIVRKYGLQAGVFTANTEALFRAFKKLRVGAVIANDPSTFRGDPMPYGGTKDSGLGREGVRYAIEEMTESKVLVLSLEP